MAERDSLFDQISKGIADAITDIRHKVIEEPAYGRAVTEGPERDCMPHWPQAREEPGPQPERDLDIDR